MGLLSTAEMARILHEQNRAYCRLIKAPWAIDSWEDLDAVTKKLVEAKVQQIIDGKVTEPYIMEAKDSVHKIMEGLAITMVEVLMEL